MENLFLLVFAVVVLSVMFGMVIFMLQLGRPWLQIFMAGGRVSLVSLLGMRFRRAPIRLLVDTFLMLQYSGEPASMGHIERVYWSKHTDIYSPDDLARHVRASPDPRAPAQNKGKP